MSHPSEPSLSAATVIVRSRGASSSLFRWREIDVEDFPDWHPLDGNRIVNLHLHSASRRGLLKADILRNFLIVLRREHDGFLAVGWGELSLDNFGDFELRANGSAHN